MSKTDFETSRFAVVESPADVMHKRTIMTCTALVCLETHTFNATVQCRCCSSLSSKNYVHVYSWLVLMRRLKLWQICFCEPPHEWQDGCDFDRDRPRSPGEAGPEAPRDVTLPTAGSSSSRGQGSHPSDLVQCRCCIIPCTYKLIYHISTSFNFLFT